MEDLIVFIQVIILPAVTSFFYTLVELIIAVPLLFVRLISTLTPLCSSDTIQNTLSNTVVTMLINGARFWWPMLKWLPWASLWNLLAIWIIYQTIKIIVAWIPTIIQYITVAIEWIVTFIGGIIP